MTALTTLYRIELIFTPPPNLSTGTNLPFRRTFLMLKVFAVDKTFLAV